MNTVALEKFARSERLFLREAVKERLDKIEIIEYCEFELALKRSLHSELQKVGYEALVEEIACTWFTILIAIRYMEVNEVLPDGINILASNGELHTPEILDDYRHLSVNRKQIEDLKAAGQEEIAYRVLFLAAVKKLACVMPFLFNQLPKWMELVLLDNILESGGTVERIVHNEGLTNSLRNHVETIGWLYQFYSSEKKKDVGGLKNIAVKKEDLPVVTQLFTPRWIVDYLNENTLGKTYDEWYETNQLHQDWKYYMKQTQPKTILPNFRNRLEELTFFDPACGTGHILISAFEMLYEMYVEQGYPRGNIPELILYHNLFGCDIDRRAAHIAGFSLYMKSLEKDADFSQKVCIEKMNIVEIQESPLLTDADWDCLEGEFEIKSKIQELLTLFNNGKQFGSLITVPRFQYQHLQLQVKEYAISEKIQPILKQVKLLSQQYDMVVTNPPYHNKYNRELKKFMEDEYADYKADLYSAFMYQCMQLTKENGYVGMVTPFTWMFISVHQKLREYILREYSISSLIQLQYSAFEKAIVPICTFVIHKQNQHVHGEYIGLADLKGDQAQFVRYAIQTPDVTYRYSVDSRIFSRIDGSPITYWSKEKDIDAFLQYEPLKSFGQCKSGIMTGNDELYVRLWHEVDFTTVKTDCKTYEDMGEATWFPLNKGGEFRKYYGNHNYVIHLQNDGEKIKVTSHNYRLREKNDYFRKSITWSRIGSSHISFRASLEGNLFGDAGPSFFVQDDQNYSMILGILNSKLSQRFLQMMNPTMNYQKRDVESIPIKPIDRKLISSLVDELIQLSKQEWDSYESSWHFKKHPFVTYRTNNNLADTFARYENLRQQLFDEVKEKDEAINARLIKAYGYQDVLKADLEAKDVTIRLANRQKDVQSFLSYFIGCLMGRYSLDVEGLAFAGGKFDPDKYSSFIPVTDGIVTLTSEKVLSEEQDLYEKLKQFLVVLYGEQTAIDNLNWIAESLNSNKSWTAEEIIRDYFCRNFFRNHCRDYADTAGRNKRPIYWLIQSGEYKAMQTLMYVHRYTPQTSERVLQDHLMPLLKKWRCLAKETEIELRNRRLKTSTKREKTKRLELYTKRIEELEAFKVQLEELVRQEIGLNLEDGVKVNFAKLSCILEQIK